jgi:hypothetical protein
VAAVVAETATMVVLFLLAVLVLEQAHTVETAVVLLPMVVLAVVAPTVSVRVVLVVAVRLESLLCGLHYEKGGSC